MFSNRFHIDHFFIDTTICFNKMIGEALAFCVFQTHPTICTETIFSFLSLFISCAEQFRRSTIKHLCSSTKYIYSGVHRPTTARYWDSKNTTKLYRKENVKRMSKALRPFNITTFQYLQCFVGLLEAKTILPLRDDAAACPFLALALFFLYDVSTL